MNRAICIVLAAVLAASFQAQGVINISPSKDNTLFQSTSGNLSEGAGVAFFCGLTNMSKKRRALVAFDVAASVPAGATILGATLSLEMNQTAGGPLNIELRQLTADWGEGTSAPATGNGGSGSPATAGSATWLHRYYPSTTWATAGGDYSAVVSATTSVWQFAVYTWSSPQMVADVQGWLDYPATNFGWMLKSPEVIVGDSKRFSSREEPNPPSRPRLTVTYSAPPAASVADLGFGCNGIHLAAVGVPSVGNSAFALDLTGGAPGAAAFVLVSYALAPSPLALGGVCFFDLETGTAIANFNAGVYLGPASLDNFGHVALPAPIPPLGFLHGGVVDLQSVIFGPTITSSNVLALSLGS